MWCTWQHIGCYINWDTRSPEFTAESEPFWFHMITWIGWSEYCDRPEAGAHHNERYQVNPTTWSSTENGGNYCGAQLKDEGPQLPEMPEFDSTSGHGNLISGWTSPDRLSFDQV